MQEIKKRRIVLASLLKPVDDTRMYEKLASTLASAYEVYVIGQPAKSTSSTGNIRFIPLPAYSRLSLQRLMASWQVLRNVLRIRPDLLIICTAELLPIALCARVLFGVKIVYDVQENYAQNILHGKVWPRLLRPLIAAAVRGTEYMASLAVSRFLLAEQVYAHELKFIRDDFVIIENKYVPNRLPARGSTGLGQSSGNDGVAGRDDSPEIRLLFTGTLAETTGLWEAIELAVQLHEIEANIRLHIIGYASQTAVRSRLRTIVQRYSFIELEGIDQLVPHSQIVEAISRANFGIVAYPPNRSTWQSYPTKLYEYLACRLPILLIENPKWVSYCAPYSAAVVFKVDAHARDVRSIVQQMFRQAFYTTAPLDIFWEGEESKLLENITRVLN